MRQRLPFPPAAQRAGTEWAARRAQVLAAPALLDRLLARLLPAVRRAAADEEGLEGAPESPSPPRTRNETCPVSTGGGTRRVQSVREGGGGGTSLRAGVAGGDAGAAGEAEWAMWGFSPWSHSEAGEGREGVNGVVFLCNLARASQEAPPPPPSY